VCKIVVDCLHYKPTTTGTILFYFLVALKRREITPGKALERMATQRPRILQRAY